MPIDRNRIVGPEETQPIEIQQSQPAVSCKICFKNCNKMLFQYNLHALLASIDVIDCATLSMLLFPTP